MDTVLDFLKKRDVAFVVGLAGLIVGWKFMMEGLDVS